MRRAELQKAVEGRERTWKGVECPRRTVESENGIPFILQQ